MSPTITLLQPRLTDRDRTLTIAQQLAHATDHKANYKPTHCFGVARLAAATAAQLDIDGHARLRGATLFRIFLAGLLHDVGKLAIPDAILLKPDKLNDTEWGIMRSHPVSAGTLIEGIGLRDEARWVLHHHERPDGNGYPTGLTGESIPLPSRIIGAADAFDCMVKPRPYHQPKTFDQALTELHEHPDQFDPVVTSALTTVIRRGAHVTDDGLHLDGHPTAA